MCRAEAEQARVRRRAERKERARKEREEAERQAAAEAAQAKAERERREREADERAHQDGLLSAAAASVPLAHAAKEPPPTDADFHDAEPGEGEEVGGGDNDNNNNIKQTILDQFAAGAITAEERDAMLKVQRHGVVAVEKSSAEARRGSVGAHFAKKEDRGAGGGGGGSGAAAADQAAGAAPGSPQHFFNNMFAQVRGGFDKMGADMKKAGEDIKKAGDAIGKDLQKIKIPPPKPLVIKPLVIKPINFGDLFKKKE